MAVGSIQLNARLDQLAYEVRNLRKTVCCNSGFTLVYNNDESTGATFGGSGTEDSPLTIDVTGGSEGVTSFNTRVGDITLTSTDINTALGYTPYNGSTNPNGYISSVPAQSFASLTSKPTTISGYGITDVLSQPLTGFVSSPDATILATDTILMGFDKTQAQLNSRLRLNNTLIGFTVGSNTPVTSSDTILGAYGKLQGQISSLPLIVGGTFSFTSNGTLDSFDIPHGLTNVTAHAVTRNSDPDSNLFETQIVDANIHVHFTIGAPTSGVTIVVNWIAFGS